MNVAESRELDDPFAEDFFGFLGDVGVDPGIGSSRVKTSLSSFENHLWAMMTDIVVAWPCDAPVALRIEPAVDGNCDPVCDSKAI